MTSTPYATMSHIELLGVVTTVVEENVALKSIVGEQSGVAKKYAELDAVRRAERDMLRKAVRPLNLQQVCSDVGVASKFSGRARTDCGVVMCSAISLLSDVGVSGLPLLKTVGGRSLSLMAKPMIFIDLCGEEPSSSDDEVVQHEADADLITADASGGSSREYEGPGEGDDLVGASSSKTEANNHLTIFASLAESECPAVVKIEEKEEEEVKEYKALGDERKYADNAVSDDALQQNLLSSLSKTEARNQSTIEIELPKVVLGEKVCKAIFEEEEEETQEKSTDDALQQNPVSGLDWFLLGKQEGKAVQYVNGKDYTADQCFVKAVEIDPLCSCAWHELGSRAADGQAGVTVRVHDQTLTYKDCLIKALELDPDSNVTAWFRLGYNKGGVVGGQPYTKKQCFVKALELDPTDQTCGHSWSNLGMEGGAVVGGTSYTGAECYAKALEIDPQNFVSWGFLAYDGGGLVNGKHYSKAQCFIQALEMDVPNVKMDRLWRSLAEETGGAHRVNGKMYNKKECYAKSVDINPKNSEAWWKLGDAGGGIRVGGSTFNKAQCYVKSLEIDSTSGTVWRSLGSAGGGRVGGQSYTKMQCYVKAKQLDQMAQGLERISKPFASNRK